MNDGHLEELIFHPLTWDFQDLPYGDDPCQTLDIVFPKVKTACAFVYIHGGAYLIGDKSQYPSFLTDYYERNVIAAINYRIIHPDNNITMQDILSDLNSALLKIITMSKANGVYIKDFILIGHSAGGHIALLYAYKDFHENIKISACISLSGPTDFTDDLGWSSMTMWGEDIEKRLLFFSEMASRLTGHSIVLTQSDWTKQSNYLDFRKYILEISPINYVPKRSNIPPTLLVHARSDNQVPYSNAIRLKMALDHASVPNKLITPTGSANSHMLGGVVYADNSPLFIRNQRWVREMQEWLENI